MSNSQNNNKYTFKDIKKIENKFKDIIVDIPKTAVDYDNYINDMKVYTEYLKDQVVTTSQIRKVYSQIMNSKNTMDLKRLRPILAYIVGKNEKTKQKYGISSLLGILDEGIAKLKGNDNGQVENFKEFMETIVAYRKYAGDDK